VPHQANRSSEYELVSFSNPPVAEVALSAQFAADTVDIEALGSFAHHVRGALPRRRRQPMAPPLVETFDRVPQVPSIEIHLEAPISLPRAWFLSESEVQLVQLQHDRLTLNWREVEQGAPYPRYGQLRERFEELFGVLGDILRDVEQSADVNLVEVTYVNPIDLAPPVGDGHPDLAKIVNRVRPRPRNAFLPEAEEKVPPWAVPVISRMEELAALPVVAPGGSSPMVLEDVMDALRFLTRVMQDDTVIPWIGRLSSGGLQLTWQCGDVEVEAVFDRTRHERDVIVAVGGTEWEAPADQADSLFATVADRLHR
jgi:uncharacterized protein (TIGR04255 family)